MCNLGKKKFIALPTVASFLQSLRNFELENNRYGNLGDRFGRYIEALKSTEVN
jgi:hypothetical protein